MTLKIKTQSSLNQFYYWRLILVTFSFYDLPSMTKNPCDVRSSGSHPEFLVINVIKWCLKGAGQKDGRLKKFASQLLKSLSASQVF